MDSGAFLDQSVDEGGGEIKCFISIIAYNIKLLSKVYLKT